MVRCLKFLSQLPRIASTHMHSIPLLYLGPVPLHMQPCWFLIFLSKNDFGHNHIPGGAFFSYMAKSNHVKTPLHILFNGTYYQGPKINQPAIYFSEDWFYCIEHSKSSAISVSYHFLSIWELNCLAIVNQESFDQIPGNLGSSRGSRELIISVYDGATLQMRWKSLEGKYTFTPLRMWAKNTDADEGSLQKNAEFRGEFHLKSICLANS